MFSVVVAVEEAFASFGEGIGLFVMLVKNAVLYSPGFGETGDDLGIEVFLCDELREEPSQERFFFMCVPEMLEHTEWVGVGSFEVFDCDHWASVRCGSICGGLVGDR